MIIHGRQQILPPNMIIGRTQIHGACIGIERIVGLWLGWQAVQAILGAFGQRDGWAVIKATNAYLNQLAESDGDKATALAGFLNEDPMMVCSLGLEPQLTVLPAMPIRWLVGDGNSWIDTGVKALPATTARCRARYDSSKSTRMDLFGVRTSADPGDVQYSFYLAYSTSWYALKLRTLNGSNSQYDVLLNSGVYEFELSPNVAKVNQTTYPTGTNVGSQYNIIAMGVRYGDTAYGDGMNGQGMAYLSLENTSGGDENLVPFISQTRNGMVDLVVGVFHPNQGTGHFTDAYTLQDGVTPWTPSTH